MSIDDGLEVTLRAGALGVDDAGRPHLVWAGDNSVHHAVLDGAWTVEALLDPAEVTDPPHHATLAVRNQVVHAVWDAGIDEWMWWGRGSLGDWELEQVRDAHILQYANNPQIAVADDGTLTIVDWRTRTGGLRELTVLRWDGMAWRDVHSWDNTISGWLPQVAMDSLARPHVIWRDDDLMKYAVDADLETVPPTTTVVGPAAWDPVLAIDGSDAPIVAVEDSDEIRVLREVGGSWISQLVDLADHSGPVGLAVDPAGTVHLVYVDGQTLEVRHATQAGPDLPWTVEVIDQEFPGTVTMWAGSSTVHVAHLRDHVLRHGERDSAGTWSWDEVARTSSPGFGVRAVHDGTGLWMAHQDGGSGFLDLDQKLVLSWSDGVSVTHETLAADGVLQDTDLALGADGLLRVTRVDGYDWVEDGSTPELVLMTGTPGAWTEERVSDPSHNPALHAMVLDASDQAVVAYHTPGDDLHIAWQGATAWTREVFGLDVGGFDIALDDQGALHVAWQDLTTWTLMYSVEDGGAWVHEVVDDSYPYTWSGCGRQVALALDPGGGPQVVYECDLPGFGTHEVRHALWTGTQWRKDVLADGLSEGVALWIDDGFVAHAAVSLAHGDLQVGDDTGGLWAMEAIASPDVGGSVDLAPGPDGEVYVAWQDRGRRDLNLSVGRADLELVPEVLEFGSVALGTTAELDLVITNIGTTDVSLPAPVIDGPHPFAFELVGGCAVLQPQDSCVLTARFVPDRVLSRVATLQVAPGHTATLTGAGRGVWDTSGCSDGCGGGCATAGPWGIELARALRRRSP